MLTYSEFKDFYLRYGSLPLGIYSNPKKVLKDYQLKNKFQKYIDTLKKKMIKDNKPSYWKEWEDTREEVYIRDMIQCRLWKILTPDEKKIAINNGLVGTISKKITPAHFIRRSACKDLICEKDNVYTMYQLFHNRLDAYQDPLTGKKSNTKECLKWWQRVINNDEIYYYLLNYKGES